MQAGIIGNIHGELPKIESISRTYEENGYELEEKVEVHQKISDLEGDAVAFTGKVAGESTSDSETVDLDGDEITVSETIEKVTNHCRFLFIPNTAVILENSSCSFLFDLLSRHYEAEVRRADVNLQSYRNVIEDRAEGDVEYWKVGFYGREDSADNGVVHGSELFSDSELSQLLGQNSTNQLGIEYTLEGQTFRVFITESGYLEYYTPSEMDTAIFVTEVLENIVSHFMVE